MVLRSILSGTWNASRDKGSAYLTYKLLLKHSLTMTTKNPVSWTTITVVYGCLLSCVFLNSCQALSPVPERSVAVSKVIRGSYFFIPAPPAYLNLDTFYTKYADASGIPIVGSDKVPDEAFFAVQKVINKMVSFRPDILEKLIENKMRIGIMATTEVTSDLPEYRNINKAFPDYNWDNDRGTGATLDIPVSTCAEENVLCYGAEKDAYFYEDILIHEFAHGFHALGIVAVDPDFDSELERVFKVALANGRWKKTYAASNSAEYFAEGVQDWFNLNAEAIPTDGIHCEINTREELKNYDPALYAILRRFFAEINETISCHK